MAFGGAESLQACKPVGEMNVAEATGPFTSGVVSSLCLLSADIKHDCVQTIVEGLESVSGEERSAVYRAIEAQARERLEWVGATDATVSHTGRDVAG